MRVVRGVFLAMLFICPVMAEAKTVTLQDTDNHTSVMLNLGDTLLVELPSTLPGQYKWVAHLDRGAPLSPQGDSLISAAGMDAKKGEGAWQFRYNAAKIGQTVL